MLSEILISYSEIRFKKEAIDFNAKKSMNLEQINYFLQKKC